MSDIYVLEGSVQKLQEEHVKLLRECEHLKQNNERLNERE